MKSAIARRSLTSLIAFTVFHTLSPPFHEIKLVKGTEARVYVANSVPFTNPTCIGLVLRVLLVVGNTLPRVVQLEAPTCESLRSIVIGGNNVHDYMQIVRCVEEVHCVSVLPECWCEHCSLLS